MSRSRSDGLATLVRWRGFQESRAAADLGQANLAVESAATALRRAEARVQELQQQRLELLLSPELDLSRLQVSAGIGDSADRDVQAEESQLDAARTEHADALHEHAQARARTSVAETRRARVASAEADRNEKMMFDWMADLRSALRAQP